MKIGQYCQRQRCRHVELEQFWQAFTLLGFVSDSWAFLLLLRQFHRMLIKFYFKVYSVLAPRGSFHGDALCLSVVGCAYMWSEAGTETTKAINENIFDGTIETTKVDYWIQYCDVMLNPRSANGFSNFHEILSEDAKLENVKIFRVWSFPMLSVLLLLRFCVIFVIGREGLVFCTCKETGLDDCQWNVLKSKCFNTWVNLMTLLLV